MSNDPSFRIVPAAAPKSASVHDTANSFGLHDTLKYGPRSLAAEVKTGNGLKERLQNWEATQDNLKLTIERDLYGLHLPLRRLMERNIVADSPRALCGPQANLHLDILMGRDETLDFSDVFLDREAGPVLDVRDESEKKA